MKTTLFILSMILGGVIALAVSGSAHAEQPGFDQETGQFVDARVEGFWEKFVCVGAGTCYRDGQGDLRKACSGGGCSSASRVTAGPRGFNQGAVIVTNSGNYVIVPNSTGGIYPSAIIHSGK